MNRSMLLLLVLCLPLVSGCGETPDGPATLPEDFRLAYAWREGSVPPPYHYEYRITVEPDGAGLIEFWPDYPGPTTPTWSEVFTVTAGSRLQLYTTLQAAGIWSTAWQEANPPRVGGSSASLEARANGRTATVPSDLVDSQTNRLTPVYAAIEALVPPAIWDNLRAQRQQYEDTYQP
jgi:hypothetical protein